MKNNIPSTGTSWQDWADSSIIKDGETGKANKSRPVKPTDNGQNAPSSNWPYGQ